MTKDQVLSELHTLMDYVNDTGKGKLRAIKEWVNSLEEKIELPAHDRRIEDRDPGEKEQNEAEALGLLGSKKKAVRK